MNKINIVIVLAMSGLFVIFIGGVFKNNKETRSLSSLANLSSQSAMVSEEENSPIPNKTLAKNETDSELEKDKKEALRVANAFLDDLKNDAAEKIIKEYISEERTISPKKIERLREIFKEYPKRSFKEYVFYGNSWILVKLCDQSCQGFYLTVSQENDGIWKIYEIKKKTAEEMKNIERSNEVLSKKPSELVVKFFDLLRDEKFSEAENLFHRRTDQWQRKGYIQKIIESQENISLGTMEILGESDKKAVAFFFLFLDEEGFSTEYRVSLSKEKGNWKMVAMTKIIDNFSEIIF